MQRTRALLKTPYGLLLENSSENRVYNIAPVIPTPAIITLKYPADCIFLVTETKEKNITFNNVLHTDFI